MQGSWQCEIWGGIFEEHWTNADGGAMLQMGRHLVEGKTRFIEYASLEADGDEVVMWIHLGPLSKGATEPVAFRLVRFDGQEAAFENPANPFPSLITYHRRANALECIISGERDGAPASDRFYFKRFQ